MPRSAPTSSRRSGGVDGDSEAAGGLASRAEFESDLRAALGYAERFRTSFALVLLGADDLPRGAAAVLAEAAERIQGALRAGDRIARFDTSGLALLLMECDEEKMKVAVPRFLAAAGPGFVAGGVALPRHARSVAEAIDCARQARQAAAKRIGAPRFAAFGRMAAGDRKR